jgi:hypothetical protein
MESKKEFEDIIIEACIGNNDEYEKFELKIKEEDYEDKTNVKLLLDKYPSDTNRNTIIIELLPTMKLSPTYKKFNFFLTAERDCKDQVQIIPDIIISNNNSNNPIITIKIPVKYNDIKDDVSKNIDKNREEVINDHSKCYNYIREHLANIILYDSFNNPSSSLSLKFKNVA